MKTERKILVVFVLNTAFAVLEFFGGVFTGSVAIVSDAVHDMGDTVGIGISYLLEKKSRKPPDERYTYGYARYSVIGSVVTTLILLVGSAAVIYNAIGRIIEPPKIDYDGMMIFALVGICVNVGAAWFAHGGDSLNQKAVSLHMFEDVLGWVVVLVGAVIMRFTDFARIDPILSVGVAGMIFANAVIHLKESVDPLLEKVPRGMELKILKKDIAEIDGVLDVHHIRIWSMDGQSHCATMHIVTNSDFGKIKGVVREKLRTYGIDYVTLEPETEGERCQETHCKGKREGKSSLLPFGLI